MSKNFELLQEIGGDEDLFRTTDATLDMIPGVNGEENREFDEAERDRVLQRATLPNPLETFEKVSGSREHSSTEEFRTPRSVTTRIGIADLLPLPSRPSREDNRQSAPSVEGSPTVQPLISSLDSASPEALPDLENGTAEEIEWGKIDWTQTLKALITPRNTRLHPQRKYPGSDLNVIAREEELKLVQRVFPGTGQNAPQVVLFSSLDDDGECLSICARSAEILTSRGDGPVCVVDANFHAPSLHRYFCVENLKGLAEAAIENAGIENFVQQIGESNLWLMPSGRAIAQLTFSAITEGLRKRMTELRYAFKYVVIQAGALRLETSEMLMSRWTDGVVLVVEANSTPRELAKRVKDNLQTAKVKLLGVVLNNRTFPIPESLYRNL
jgi:Mrp family chromosome partitioning ATPase